MTLTRPFALTAVLLLCSASQAAAQDSPELEFVAPDELAVTTADDESKKVSVWLRNTSDKDATPAFKAVLEDADGNAVSEGSVEVGAVDAAAVGAGDVARYRLFLRGDGLAEDISGELVATATGLAPASIEVSATRETVEEVGVNWTLWLALIFAGVVVLASILVAGGIPGGKIPEADFKFSESFASTLTVVGALLGTAISAGVLPEGTGSPSKEAFIALNLLFGVAVVVAGAVYAALPPRVWSFLVAAAITSWAVFGELLTLFQLVDGLGQDQGFTGLAIVFFRILLGVAALAMAVYILKRITELSQARSASTEQAAALAQPAARQRIALL